MCNIFELSASSAINEFRIPHKTFLGYLITKIKLDCCLRETSRNSHRESFIGCVKRTSFFFRLFVFVGCCYSVDDNKRNLKGRQNFFSSFTSVWLFALNILRRWWCQTVNFLCNLLCWRIEHRWCNRRQWKCGREAVDNFLYFFFGFFYSSIQRTNFLVLEEFHQCHFLICSWMGRERWINEGIKAARLGQVERYFTTGTWSES